MTQNTDIQKQADQSLASVDPEVAKLLAQAAENQAKTEVSGIPFMSLKGKKFTLGDVKLGTSLNVVILADVIDYSYYDRPYNTDEITPPACFAIGRDINELAPHENSPTPISDSCKGCPNNEFGSAANGKGKACRNGRRILVASVLSDGSVNLDDLAIINMAPTSLKAYSRYAKSLATVRKLPSWSVVTNLSFDPDEDWPVLVPMYIGVAPGSTINAIAQRLEEFNEVVAVAYDTSNYEAPNKEAAAASDKKKSKMS